MGQALTKALTDLDHCLNSNKLKDDIVNGLKDENVALHKQLDVEETRIAELKKANDEHKNSEQLNETRNTAQEERFKLEEQRVAMYKSVVDDFEKEVNRLRAKLQRAELWGNIKFVLGVGLGAALMFAATN